MPRWPALTLSERLHAKIDASGGPDACHPWKGARTTKHGVPKYGHLVDDGRVVLAHRAIWEETHGAISAATLCVLHRCDNPICCNPRHLFLGTNADNIRDMYDKGRRSRLGTPCVVLSDTDRENIRALYARGGHTLRALAATFGASYGCIHKIVRG